MREIEATVLSNEPVGRDFHRIELLCPDMTGDVQPGQFVTVRGDWGSNPLLRRPFSVADCDAGESLLVLLVKRVGPATELLSALVAGDALSVTGPMGHGFDLSVVAGAAPTSPGRLYIVAGGCGIAPLPLVVRCAKAMGVLDVVLLYGAAGARDCDVADWAASLVHRISIATEDGSRGVKGLVTDLLAEELAGGDDALVCACGPTPMLRAVAAMALEAGIPCQVSIEAHMACGIGVCNGCVIPVASPTGRAYKKCCTDGPVFDAADVLWSELEDR